MSKTLSNNDEVDATQPVLYSDDELVTVADFPDPATANVARTALESANIEVLMQGENANSLLPIAFGVRAMVRPQDEAAARAILADFEAKPETMESVAAAETADEREYDAAGESSMRNSGTREL